MFSLHEFVDWLVHSDPQSAKHETGDAPPFLKVYCWADTAEYFIVEIMKMIHNTLKIQSHHDLKRLVHLKM